MPLSSDGTMHELGHVLGFDHTAARGIPRLSFDGEHDSPPDSNSALDSMMMYPTMSVDASAAGGRMINPDRAYELISTEVSHFPQHAEVRQAMNAFHRVLSSLSGPVAIEEVASRYNQELQHHASPSEICMTTWRAWQLVPHSCQTILTSDGDIKTDAKNEPGMLSKEPFFALFADFNHRYGRIKPSKGDVKTHSGLRRR